jgi:hypothetical protein
MTLNERINDKMVQFAHITALMYESGWYGCGCQDSLVEVKNRMAKMPKVYKDQVKATLKGWSIDETLEQDLGSK